MRQRRPRGRRTPPLQVRIDDVAMQAAAGGEDRKMMNKAGKAIESGQEY